jgi:hypothetical protein
MYELVGDITCHQSGLTFDNTGAQTPVGMIVL